MKWYWVVVFRCLIIFFFGGWSYSGIMYNVFCTLTLYFHMQCLDFTDADPLNGCCFLTLFTQVFFTKEGKGWGLRTLDELPKGAFVCEYVGELLTSTELHERTSQNVHNGRYMYPVLLDANWGSKGLLKDEEALCLDATFYGNVGRFINHRCALIFPYRFIVVLFYSKYKP